MYIFNVIIYLWIPLYRVLNNFHLYNILYWYVPIKCEWSVKIVIVLKNNLVLVQKI